MLKHDDATMKGHISDVDTLLVFVCLCAYVFNLLVLG